MTRTGRSPTARLGVFEPLVERPSESFGRSAFRLEEEVRLDQLELHEEKGISARDAVDSRVERNLRQCAQHVRRLLDQLWRSVDRRDAAAMLGLNPELAARGT